MKGRRKIRNWSIAGFFTIVILGSLFHFVYDWTNEFYLAGAIFPVNESVWEHLKLGLWAVITFSAVEYFVLYKEVHNYFIAKWIGVVIISIAILLIYYTYTMFAERNILAIDIASYVIGVLLSQIFCYKIYQLENSKVMNKAGVLLLIFTCVIFAMFTYYPPQLDIFKDERTGIYGIDY